MSVDIGVKRVKKYYYSDTPDKNAKERLEAYNYNLKDLPEMVFKIDEDSESFDPNAIANNSLEGSEILKRHLEEEGIDTATIPKYFYEVEFEKPGGLVMPLIVEYAYADGTTRARDLPSPVVEKKMTRV